MKHFKSLLFICLFCAAFSSAFGKNGDETDSALYNEIVYCFNTGFYSGALGKINQLEKSYPSSEYKAECDFIRAQSYYYQKKYVKALNCCYQICENKNHRFYDQAVLFAGRAYFQRQDFEKSIPLFEYVITNGSRYDQNDYVEALKRLFIAYNNSGNKDKTTSLLSKFSEEDFGKEIYEELKVNPDSLLADFYKAKKLVSEGKYSEAEKSLNRMAGQVESGESVELKDAYYSLLLRCYALQGKWNKIPDCYRKISVQNNNAIYFAAFAAYFSKDYDAVVKLLENKVYLRDLYSVSLSMKLFKEKKYAESYKVSVSMKIPEAVYLSGLNSINLKNWKRAKTHFDSFLGTNPVNVYSTWFFKGYAEYMLGDYRNAYVSFNKYMNQSEELNHKRTTCELALKSAVTVGNKEDALEMAKVLYELGGTQTQLFNAALTRVELYSEYNLYEEGVSVLLPFVDSQDKAIASQSIYNIALIYEKAGEFDKADGSYEKLSRNYPGEVLGEEALFRRGRLQFTQKNYDKAESIFNQYIYDYASGANVDASMYYCAQCYGFNGKNDRALMMYRTLIQKYPESPFIYGALKKLMYIYYEREQFSEAYDITLNLMKDFNSQAVADEIPEKQKELKKILSGTDKEIVRKTSEYLKYGKNTLKGRIAGTELVQLYMKNETNRDEAYNLAEELLSLQISDNELPYAAINAGVVAKICQYKNDYEKAAAMYLKAAELYRKITDSETEKQETGIRPAEMLYAAVECFVSAGFDGDAEETAKLLIELYPKTKQAKGVKAILANR